MDNTQKTPAEMKAQAVSVNTKPQPAAIAAEQPAAPAVNAAVAVPKETGTQAASVAAPANTAPVAQPQAVSTVTPAQASASAPPRSANDEPVMAVLPTESITGKTEVLIECKKIVRRFNIGSENELEILHGIDLKIYKGEFVAIVGASGSGKSTLMNIMGALDLPTSGTCTLNGMELTTAGENELSDLRNKYIGFVFQSYNLIARSNALENVALPMMYAHVPQHERDERAQKMLELVEMGERAKHMPNEMSGGQRQRVSIARAMANDPPLILADEATGALDSKTGHLIMNIFHDLHENHGKTIVFITHSPELAEECERMVTIKDGRVISDRKGRGRTADVGQY